MVSLASSSEYSTASPPFQALLSRESIPRVLTRIPKDQLALLDREDSWIAALKGSGRRGAANVPPKVIEDVKYFHTSRTLPPPAQKQNGSASSGPTQTEPASPTPNEEQDGDKSDSSSDDQGTSVCSWPQSPERPPRSANPIPTQHATPSIKSQVVLESQSAAPRILSQSPSSDIPSSPRELLSSPIRPAPKRPYQSHLGLKRRPIEDFPSSSAGPEEELETAIPDALIQATPPMQRMAPRLAAASDAVTSPPCGQGSLIPSTYSDAKSPERVEAPNKRRRVMKPIKFSPSPQELIGDHPSDTTSARLSTIPFTLPLEAAPPTYSDSLAASASHAVDVQLPLDPQVIQDTPEVARTLAKDQKTANVSFPSSKPSGLPARAPDEGKAASEANIELKSQEVASDNGYLDPSKQEIRRQKAMTFLDDEWNAENIDWLPPTLQHFRSTLSPRSLETLQSITNLAIKNGTKLSRLWSEPDGYLYRASLNQKNGSLSFHENLVHKSLDFFEAEIARPASRRKNAPDMVNQDSSHTVAPIAVNVLQQTAASPPVVEGRQPHLDDASRLSKDANAKRFAQEPLEAFCSAYPSYTGSSGDFVRACMTIKDLRRKRALPKWLYDDFIRAFVDGFIPYIETLDEGESPFTALQWYVENVDRPSFQSGIVTGENLHQVFKFYSGEFKSARESLSHRSSPRLAVERSLSIDMSEAIPQEDPMIANLEPATPHESSRTPGSHPSPRQQSPTEIVVISEAKKGPVDGQDTATEGKDYDALLAEPRPVGYRDKGQRMPAQETRTIPEVPAFAATIQSRKETIPGDDEVTFVFSTARPRSSHPDATGSKVSIAGEDRGFHATPSNQVAPRHYSLTDRRENTAPKTRRDGVIAETPPRSSAAAAPSIQTPVVRRSLPPRFLTRPPSNSAPSGSPASTLSASTQGNRVKKSKNTETEKERRDRKLRAKYEKMIREGRLRLPGSSMPSKS